MESDARLSNARRRRSASWTYPLSITLIGRQVSECGNVAGIQEEGRREKTRRQFQYFICEREEGEEAPRRPRHLHPDGVGPRGRVREAAGRPQQIIGRFHYFSIMHIVFAAG